ncbi:MAG: hypothetical protein JXQ26_09745 [Tissierellales bacterium]|nr:hypothetical protein [Tissierellales bacterium]MBN2828264.1 hypothetical protein [Tissierellales bacterium]
MAENTNNEFPSIRIWLNEVFNDLKSNTHLDEFDFIVFSHQDVFIPKTFFESFEKLYLRNDDNEDIGLIGFAGITSNGETFSLMKDSDLFIFNGDFHPVEVDAVDEFLFIIPSKILKKIDIKLIDIKGWHAYAAELSIILRKKNFKTYVFPIYVEHNSVRTNNAGLFRTHQEIYKHYKIPIKTLVGDINHYSGLKRVKRILNEQYYSRIKFKLCSPIINQIKSFILDDLKLRFSIQRKLNSLYKGNIAFLAFSNKLSNPPHRAMINLKNAQIYFIQIDSVNFQQIEILKEKYDVIVLSGIPYAIENAKHLNGFQILRNK